jgi:hypothetical protein
VAKASGNPPADSSAVAPGRVARSVDAPASDGAPPQDGTSATDRVSRWTIGVLFVLVLAAQRSMLDRSFDFMDDGRVLQFAEMAANGQQLYRDVTSYPLPGAFWLRRVMA